MYLSARLPPLNRRTSNHDRPRFLPSRHLKKMTEQGEMGFDSQIRLAKVDEGGDVQDGVWIQVNKLNLVEMQKTTEESAGGDRKSAVEEELKNHNLTNIRGGEGFSIGGAPPDDLLLWKNPVLHHPAEMFLGGGGPLPHLLRWRDFGHWGKARWNRGTWRAFEAVEDS